MTNHTSDPQTNNVYSPSVPELIRQMKKKGQLRFFMDAWQDYGDLAHMKFGPQEMFLVVHPDAVRHVNVSNSDNYDKLDSYDGVRELLLGDGLVASRGDLWRRHRWSRYGRSRWYGDRRCWYRWRWRSRRQRWHWRRRRFRRGQWRQWRQRQCSGRRLHHG